MSDSMAMPSIARPYPTQGWSVQYPSPFFDIASTYMPQTIREMMRWFKYYSVMDDIAASTIRRLAAFPVTKIVFEEPDKDKRKLYEELFEDQLGLKSFLVRIGLDYFTFGNAFVSVLYPFKRFLVCMSPTKVSKDPEDHASKPCGAWSDIRRTEYKWKKKWFWGKCKKCGAQETRFEVVDRYLPMRSAIRLKCWDPEQIEILSADECVGEVYYYRPSDQVVKAIERGDRYTLETIPKVFLDAVRMGGAVRLDPRWVYHFKRQARSDTKNSGWGIGVLAGVLKKLFYKQVLLKAQEQLAHQHIVPLWVLYPSTSGDLNPFTDINLGTWRSTVERQIARWRRDPNYIPIMPIPLGFQQIGGDQSEAGIHQQLEAVNKDIIAGMGTLYELVFGGLSYSAASVSVRLAENDFSSYQHDLNRVAQQFIVGNVCRFIGLKPVKTRLQSLKMADDVQQKTALAQLLQFGVVSKRRLLEVYDIDADEDKEWREQELKDASKEMIETAIAQARAQAAGSEELQKAQIRMQLRMQRLQQEVQMELAEEAGMDPQAVEAAAQGVQEGGGFREVNVAGEPQPTQQEQVLQAMGGMAGGKGGGGGGGPPGKGGKGGGGDQGGGGSTMGAGGNQMMAEYARTLGAMPGDLQLQMLTQLDTSNPQMGQAVRAQMAAQGGGGKGKGSTSKGTPKPGQMDMRPQPKQKPPRRATKSV